MSGTGTITRELAAKYAIKTLKLDYIAKLNIFEVDYKDASKIKKDNVGYVVLADELELVPTRKSKTFEPTDTLTREEAANMLLQLISKYNH